MNKRMPRKSKPGASKPLGRQQAQARLQELEETLRAIRSGEVDALLVSSSEGDRVFTLEGADHPFRVMVEAINEGAATVTADGMLLYANSRLSEMVNIPLEKLIGSNLSDIVQPMQFPTLDELLEWAMKVSQKEECNLRVAGGRVLPAYLSLSPLQGASFQGICLIATDLTDQKKQQGELSKMNAALEIEIAVRKQAESAMHRTEEVFRSFMDRTPAVVFIKDETGRYVFCNRKVEEIVGVDARELVGKTPTDWLPGEAGKALSGCDHAALAGKVPTEHIDTLPTASGESLEVLMVRFPFRDPSGRRLLGGVGMDVTPQKRAEKSLQQLTGRLLNLQDEERRRIARDLHDSTAQTLAAMALNLGLIQAQCPIPRNSGAAKLLAETVDLANQASNEVRNLAHLLHPPDLDMMGLIPAIQWHTSRVTEVSGINITLDLPRDLGRLPKDIETALFRILQESLENVRRHSRSRVAKVRLVRQKKQIVLEIEDRGKGATVAISTTSDMRTATPGLGVAGMRERMRQLGGALEFSSGQNGTTVSAAVPLP
jgi:PAS domain S-box-containing protein